MKNVVNEPRIVQLKDLLTILAEQIDERPGARDMASLARQYRETLKDIEEIEKAEDMDDDIGDIIRSAAADGADRSEVSAE